jgi:peptidoglycan/xylan/chitin deacetylase (PgdA/CDA1 family)
VFDVGVHGKTHRPLTSLTEMEISQDLSEARALITREIGVRPTFYCYPYGSADARTISAVSKLGFAGACGTEKGLNCGGRDRFCMRRNEVGRGLEETHFSLLVTEYALWYSRIGRWARA